ncbi:MAG: SseB family protein [Oscillospiraceae bacterium]|nr:SseB family protein [Oscillospiraceae bacterium]
MAEITRSQQPITNPALVEAMDAMKAERTPVTESRFVNTLKAARFLVPANITSSQKAVQNEDGTVEQ